MSLIMAVMRNEALEVAAGVGTAAGTKSAATAATSGVMTAFWSVMQGVNWATLIGISATVVTLVMTWYFKNEERKRQQRQEDREVLAYENRKRESDLRISLMLAGLDPEKLPKTESDLMPLQDREVANG